MIKCPFCGMENDEGFSLCQKCAKQLPVFDDEESENSKTNFADYENTVQSSTEEEPEAGENIGRYIVNSAIILGFLAVVSALILLIIDLMEGDPTALLDLVWGGIGVICSFALYGFGILVDDIHEIRKQITTKNQ